MPEYSLPGLDVERPSDGEYWIAPNATVIGQVRFKKNASVWFGAVIRADNDFIEIGENTNVQDNSVLHVDAGSPMVVGANVTIGHMAMLHGARVGDGSLIGIGAVLLDGSRIGAGCIIGAGALVTEGREIPDGMLAVGTPARVLRPVTDAERGMLAHSARHYVDNWRRYAAGLAGRP